MLIRKDARAERRALLCQVLDRLADTAPTEDGRAGLEIELADLAGDAYLLAMLDLLAALGAIELLPDPLLVRVRSPLAGYMLRLLSDLLDTGEPLVADWRREGLTPRAELAHPFGAAVDLLAALDRRRLELLPGAAPVREVEAAIALIMRRDERGGREYLLVWDAAARAWQLPGGRRELRDVSARATLLRELREELGLEGELGLTELGQPLTAVRLSPTYGLLTRTVFRSYVVRLSSELPLLPGRRWVGEVEALAGRTTDEESVSAGPLARLLARCGAEIDALLSESAAAPGALVVA